MFQAARAVTSLDKPIGSDNEGALGDLVAGSAAPPEDEVHVSLEEEVLRRAVAALPEREREVVRLRYGLEGDSGSAVARADRQAARPHARARAADRVDGARAARDAARDRRHARRLSPTFAPPRRATVTARGPGLARGRTFVHDFTEVDFAALGSRSASTS